MPKRYRTEQSSGVQERQARPAGGVREATFSVLLGSPRTALPSETLTTGLITWSYVANPKLELVDMYVDVL